MLRSAISSYARTASRSPAPASARGRLTLEDGGQPIVERRLRGRVGGGQVASSSRASSASAGSPQGVVTA